MSTGIAPSNVQKTSQQLYGAHNTVTNTSVQASESDKAKTKKSTLTYGEYKRRQSEEKQKIEKQLEDCKRRKIEDQRRAAETLREEEKNRKDEREKEALLAREVEELKRKEAEEREIRESQKKRLDIRSILFTALQPYEEKIEKVWNAEKLDHITEPSKERDKNIEGKQDRQLKSGEKENAVNICAPSTGDNNKCNQPAKDKAEPKKTNSEDENNTTSNVSDINKKSDKSLFDEQENKINNRFNRLFNEMQCTIKGFEQLPLTIGGKRRSSVHARTVISEQLKNSQENEMLDANGPTTLTENGKRRSSDTQNECSQTVEKKRCTRVHPRSAREIATINKSTTPTRPSSIHARSAIAQQLNSQSSLESESDNYTPSDDNVSFCSPSDLSKDSTKRNAVGSAIKHLGDENTFDTSSDSEINDISRFRVVKAQRLTANILKRQPKVKLRRLTEGEIKRHSKIQEKPKLDNILNVHLIESGIRPDTTNAISKTSATTSKKSPPKKCNNDCQMTERNTKFCALCSSKPSDLTNHYKRKHKCESYVSRLTWAEMDELCLNTPFAKLVPNANSRIERYAVLCPFCDEKLVVPFMNLYSHYASHTGEYAFQCAGCQLDKPFRADIQSHQLHSKNCRNSQIQTMYRYPSNSMSIYLHYCTICNFVQLNEANVLKHLREHHDPRKSTPGNVQKCILAAISDGPEESTSNEAQPTNNEAQAQTIASDDTQDMNVVNELIPENESPVIAKTEIDLNLDDNIPVFNEACTEDPFDLEERLRQMHEKHSCEKSAPQESMTVIHFDGKSSGAGAEIGVVLNKAPSRHVPKVFTTKAEPMDCGENSLQTPPRPLTTSNRSYTKNISSYCNYRSFPANVNYLGLYKCMAGDCYYSSDSPDEFVKHLEDHQRENLSGEYLLCPYCILHTGYCESINQLVNHIRTQHAHLLYQCSMCCYRSCEPSNVLIHQRENHQTNFQVCKIYKCFGTELSLDTNYFKENMSESVAKVQCPYCSNSFYNTILLIQHIRTDHKTTVQERIERYSCIYCFFWDKDQSVIRTHMALSHPGEFPFICDHNSSTVTEDSLHHLEPTCLSESVPFIDAPSTYDTAAEEISPQNECVEDKKPSVEELVSYQAETVKIRLRKLTENTGAAPDCLYRCPELSCGGFFSNYDLWLRHMRVRHCCLECRCSHCPTHTTQTLEEFKLHFEEHRRHTFVCFHCPRTYSNYQHAQNHWLTGHSDLGSMHVEQIRFNLNYSYYIMVQPNKFENLAELLSSFCDICDQRIKHQESNEATKLKHKWLVPTSSSSSLWLEDYPRHAISPKLVKKCFHGDCLFRTKSDDALFRHVRSTHDMSGSIFKCSKCDFRLENSSSWDEALNHIKQHSETRFFICGACSNHYLCRSKIAEHVRSAHAARDVPIVTLLKMGQLLYAKIAIVFANERLTFSSMRNCFCCGERNMKGNALMLHLKRYHNFVLNYCCEWCNLPIDSLQSVEKHFQETHTTNKLKIRCELTSKCNLTILSVNEFQIQISTHYGDQTDDNSLSPIFVKEEPDADDSVIILEDDDILVENYEKTQKTIEETAEKPKLKCIATANLLNPSNMHPTASQSVNQLRIMPHIKIVNKMQSPIDSSRVADQVHMPSVSNNNTIPATSNIQPINTTASVISSQRIILAPSSAPNNPMSILRQSSNTPQTVNSIQPNSNACIAPNNMVSGNHCRTEFSAGSTIVDHHAHAVQSTSVPGVVATSFASAVNEPHYYCTNTMPQSVIEYSNSSYRGFEMQSMHSRNEQFAQGPMTITSFLNSHHVPTQTTTATAITNAQPHHFTTIENNCNFQNMSHVPNVNPIPRPFAPTRYKHILPKTLNHQAAPTPHTVSTILSTKPAAPRNQVYVNSPQTQTAYCTITNAVVPPSSGHTMQPNYNLPSTASVSYSQY